MPKFVRCMEGHAFDSEQSEVCPTCGASVWRGSSDAVDDDPRPGRGKWLLAGGGGIAALAAVAVGYLLLRSPAPAPAPAPAPPTAEHTQASPPEQSAPPAVTAQTQPPQPPVVTTPQKPAPSVGGQTIPSQPAGTGQPIPPATVTQANPPPPVGGGHTVQPPPSSASPPAGTDSPPPAPQPAPVVMTPPSPAPAPPPVSVPSNFTPAPTPVIATAVIGRAHFAQDTLATLDVDGTPVRLQGVMSQANRQHDAAERFLSYITQGTNQVRCEPEGDKTYECRAVPTDVRIGAGVVANGFASADPAAPAEFQHWQDDARRAHRGIWAAQTNR